MDNNENAVRKSISKYISEYLKKTNMSKAKFGKIFGVSATSVTRWIECICSPNIELIPKISEVINVPIQELLGVSEARDYKPSEVRIMKDYSSNMEFKDLVDRYMSDESFRKTIDYIVGLKDQTPNN